MGTVTINEVENLIEVRSEPHIYVFSTNTIPNYVKVGDTFRPISTRLGEWKEIYKDLQRLFPNINSEIEALAKVNDDIYFRDYAIHTYLTNNNYRRLTKEELEKEIGENIYFSNEFFKGVSVDVVKKGIQEVKDGYESKNPNYNYYKIADKHTIDTHWNNDKDWKLRDNQSVVVDNFCDKVETEKELLMYAVMRFGKSFTAISCAKAKNYKKVLVVSAKADVATEWKKTVEMPKCFSEYAFLYDRNFVNNPNIISDVLNDNSDEFKGKNAVVVFLTLQNLIGKDSDGKNIKKKLEKIYATTFDMIIVDETHYGAWAESYGKPLNKEEEDEKVIKEGLKELEKFNKESTKLTANVRLHLSGTPYNLLYENKFTQKNIIATCQFSDILRDKEKWYEIHKKDIDAGVNNPETGLPYEEYDNPYYGFPKMLRFAFNLPEEIQANLLKDKQKYTLNDLLLTNKQDDTKFLHEEDVLKLLKVIDGKETDSRVLSFLNVPKIKDNDVCKHIVMVLPYKYSCDAMDSLLNANKNDFINLKNYKVLNITGHKSPSELDSVEKVKEEITRCEKAGIKTITLTVNKMLTGVTVPEWDTMIMLKNTKSAQEYDQAVFRIQNQYVKEIETSDSDGNKRIAKIDMKPQTILVDFDPIRMFEIQGLSTRIVSDINHQDIDLDEALKTELKFFPIITNNATGLVQVTPTNIVEVIANYNKNISILEASEKAVLDEEMLLDASILEYIKKQSDKGISSGLSGNMHESDDKSKVDVPKDDDDTGGNTNGDGASNNGNQNQGDNSVSNKEIKELREKYRKCIARLMFYTFLTKTNISSIKDVVRSVEEVSEYQQDNIRIFDNLELDLPFLKAHIEKCRKSFSFDIDSLLEQANLLSKDESLTKEEQVKNALARFSRISESEIVTPTWLCDKMYGTIGADNLLSIISNDGKILDIASKTAEFTVALYQLLKDKVELDKIKESIYCIPTSKITYEFTRKIYEILNFPLDHISCPPFTSYGLLEYKKKDSNGNKTNELDYEEICKLIKEKFSKEGENEVKFEAIVGNPPYQENISNAEDNSSLGKQIFPSFVRLSIALNSKVVSLITPSRWFTGDAQDKSFLKLREFFSKNNHISHIKTYPTTKDVFASVVIKGGVNFFVYEKDYSGLVKFTATKDKQETISEERPLFEKGYDIVFKSKNDYQITKKVAAKEFVSMETITTGRNAFGVIGKPESLKKQTKNDFFNNAVKVYCKDGETRWIEQEKIKKGTDLVDKYKVFISKSAGDPDNDFKVIGKAFVGEKHSICTDTYFPVGNFDSQEEAINLCKYFSTKFLRFLVNVLKSSQNVTQIVYRFVPIQDFTANSDIDWSKSIPEIDKQLYVKYNLTEEEISFIESMIKPME